MSKPKNMTPEQESEWIMRNNERARKNHSIRMECPEYRKNRRKRQSENYHADPEKYKSYSKKYASKNPEKIEATQRKSRLSNKEKHYESSKKWRKNNPDKWAEIKKRDVKNNRTRVIKYQRKYQSDIRQQAAADQFFLLTGAVQQISEAITNKQNDNTDKPESTD